MWRSFALTLLFLLPAVARAQGLIVDTPVLDPASPLAGQPVDILLHGGACVLYLSDPSQPASVTRQGNVVKLTVQAIVGPSGFCVYPIGTSTPFPIGSFAPGSYVVEVDAQYQDFSGGYATEVIGVLPFLVSAFAPATALSRVGLVLLIIVVACAACVAPDNSFKRTADAGPR